MFQEDILRGPELIPLVRRWFFEQLTAGLLTPEQIRQSAAQLNIELEADGYAIALFTVPPEPRDPAAFFTDPAAAARSALLAHFLKYSDYVLFYWGPNACAVLIKGSAGQLDDLIRRCVDTVQTEYDRVGLPHWHIAVSDPVAGLDELPACFQQASLLWAWQYIQPRRHILRPGTDGVIAAPGDGGPAPYDHGPSDRAASMEDEASGAAYPGALGLAVRYIHAHFTEPDLTLSQTAAHANLTPSYLSALFRKEVGCTFTEYVTDRRMALAKRLLRSTDDRTGRVARAVGFRDAHYFSALFKRTQGCTPTQFRAGT